MREEGILNLFKATLLLLLTISVAKSNSAAQLLNFQNPIKEVEQYADSDNLEAARYQESLTKSKEKSLALCQENYTGEEFLNCQSKISYAYLVLEGLPNIIDRMGFQGVNSIELKAQAEKEARAIAFSLLKSAFRFEANNG